MILVTGAGGLLGGAVVRELLAAGIDFVAPSSADVDLRDAAATARLVADVHPETILHLAARVHGLGGNLRFPAEMFADNVLINLNVLQAAHRLGCRKLVAASTVAVYAADAPQPVTETAIWDGPPHRSEQAYGHAKRAMLAQLEAIRQQHGLSFAYAIFTNIYGPNDRFDPVNGHVVPSLVAKFHRAQREGGRVAVWGTGAAERDFIEASDAARALLLIAERHEGPINVATGAVVAIRDVVDMLSAHTGVVQVDWDFSKPDGQIKRRYDVSRLAGLGFRPRVGLRDGLAATYDWYAARYPDVRA